MFELIEDEDTAIFLSIGSLGETQIKVQLGKLNIPYPLPDVVNTQQQQNNVQLLPIELRHIYALGKLPHHHRDPFDRILIAQAIAENMTLLTHDSKIAQYPVNIVW